MYWIEVTADFLHQYNNPVGNGQYHRAIRQFTTGERFIALAKGGTVFNDPLTREVTTEEHYSIRVPGSDLEFRVRPDKFKEIPFSSDEAKLARIIYGK